MQLQDANGAETSEFSLVLEGNGTDLEETGTQVNDMFFRLRELSPYPADEEGIEDHEYSILIEYSSEPF